MNYMASELVAQYLREQESVFTVDDFHRFLKDNGVKAPKQELDDVLHVSDYVFPLVDNQFVTRAGAFTGRWFSFKPSKEEVEKGYFIIGHRCMPFCNPEVSPDSIQVYSKGKEVPSEAVTFSMNLALDTFALYGEGYVIPFVFNDKNNTSLKIVSVQYNMPTEITLTAWPIKKIAGNIKFNFGDRIICRVTNWADCTVEMFHLPNDLHSMVISEDAVMREEWYSKFEEGLIAGFDRHGPGTSIEQQLAFLFLENQEQLCTKSCGSCEEFMAHTNKIAIVPYGVESRIWKANSTVPYSGPWNYREQDDLIMTEVATTFTPQIIDAYLEDNIYDENIGKEAEPIENLVNHMFPKNMTMSGAERKLVLLNIEKRRDILKRNYNRFSDYSIASIRKRTLNLFTQISALLCAIGCSGIRTEVFPQQELVVLTQLYTHTVRLLEEFENVFMRSQFPIEDVSLSMDGMYETFEDIRGTLKNCLERNRYKGFGIIDGNNS